MGGVLFYTATIGFVLGIFVRSFFDIGLSETVWLMTVSFVLGVIWRRKSKAFSSPYLLSMSVFLLLFSLGALRMDMAQWGEINQELESQVETEVQLEGVVVREPDVRELVTHIYLRTETDLLLVTTDRFTSVSYGDQLRVTGILSKPTSFETDLGRTFDYSGYLKAKGVQYVVRRAYIEKFGSERGNIIIATLLSVKQSFIRVIEEIIPEPQAGLSEGLLLGVKKALGADLESAFRKTGIIHIVVLSGYNVMLVVAFVMYVLSFLFPMRWRLPFGIAAITSFALMVGLSATVVRASIMASFVLIARATGRTYAVLRGLMVAGLMMLLINPHLLSFDTGFQLSFVATLGLILVAPALEEKLGFMPTSIGLREFFIATLATQIFVTPLLLYQIGEFSVVAVLVNILVLPMVPVAMLLTFVTGIVSFISLTVAIPVAFLANASLLYIVAVAEFFASLPFASFIVPEFPFFVVPLSYAFLGIILYFFQKKEESKNKSLSHWTIEEEGSVQTPVFFR